MFAVLLQNFKARSSTCDSFCDPVEAETKTVISADLPS